jgi:hypothetical protein
MNNNNKMKIINELYINKTNKVTISIGVKQYPVVYLNYVYDDEFFL